MKTTYQITTFKSIQILFEKPMIVTDNNGIIQSYYASTGTAVFRNSNDRYNSKKHTEKNMSNRRFISFCTGEEDILTTFF